MEKEPKLRILHYIGSLNIGGSQTMIMELYRNIDKTNIQFDFIVDRKDELFYKDEIESLGGKIFIIEKFKGYNFFSYKKQLKKLFNEHKEYNIIHGHVRSVASIYLKVAKKCGLKTIVHSHSTSNGKGLQSIIKKILQHNIRYIADYFMGCSKEANIWLFGKKIANSNKCFIINNSFNIKKYLFSLEDREFIRKQNGISDDEIVIGHVGRFVDVKNHTFIIQVFKKLIDHNKNYKLLLIGYGELWDKIKDLVNKEGLSSKVIFKKSADVCKYYSAFDMFVLPSKYEGLGIVLVEAQLSGLNCLASNTVPKAENNGTTLLQIF